MIFFLLFFPTLCYSIQCYLGGVVNAGKFHTSYLEVVDCPTLVWCYKNFTDDHDYSAASYSCGDIYCYQPKCSKYDAHSGTCCCTTDLCNSSQNLPIFPVFLLVFLKFIL